MAIKKKNKVSSEFNMSSLTDIIFLLLIFFMLTSSLIVPNALNLQLPGSKNSSPSKDKLKPATVAIKSDGTIYYNQRQFSLESLETELAKYKRTRGDAASVSVSPDAKASNEVIVGVLDIVYRYEIKAALLDPQ